MRICPYGDSSENRTSIKKERIRVVNIEHLILCIFPAILLVIMIIKVKIAPKGTFHEDFLSLQQSKILQGMIAVSIVFHHLSQYITTYGNEWKGPITLYSSMGILFTTIFFFCSGFGLMTSFQTKPDYLKTFIKRRIPAVLIPFLISNIIYFLFVGVYFDRVDSVIDSLVCIIGIRLINTNTWFLVEILLLYLAFYLTHHFIKKPCKAMGVLSAFVGILMLVSLLLCHDNSEKGGRWFMGEWWYNTTIFFLVGMYTARYYTKIIAFFKKHYKWLLPVSVVAFFLMFDLEEVVLRSFGYYKEWEGHPGYGAKFFTLIAQILVCATWLVMVLLISMKVRFKNRVLILLGKISLEIYIIHELFKLYLVYNYERSDVVLFLWVLVCSIAVAIPLHMLHQLLIRLISGPKNEIPEEEKTPERKIMEARIRKRNRKIAVCAILVGIVVTVFVIKELYVMYVQPKIYYDEELQLLAEAEVGDTIPFGTMNTDYIKSGDERIMWYVADRQGNEVLLVSVYALSPGEFHNVYEVNCWANSSMREFLNGTCYEDYINDYEKTLVIESDIETPMNEVYGTSGGRMVKDYVFLLSAEEAAMYFADDAARRLQSTQAAARDGVNVDIRDGVNYTERDNNTWWWLRTMGEDGKKTAVVNTQGVIDYEGRHSTVASGGIRPAMWVRCVPVE